MKLNNLDNNTFLKLLLKNQTTLNFCSIHLHSADKCNEFASFSKHKIFNIRNNIVAPSAGRCNLYFSTFADTLSNFTLTNNNELQVVVQLLSSTTCDLDPVPTKDVFSCLLDNVLEIVSSSLFTGIFPIGLKQAIVTPLLKKSNLDPCVFQNYRPISNVPFLGKILEKVVYQQLHAYLSHSNLFDIHQTGFKVKHSTETALVKVVNDLKINSDNRKVSILVLLDLSAAFDTVDLTILVHRLEHCLGIRGIILNWLS